MDEEKQTPASQASSTLSAISHLKHSSECSNVSQVSRETLKCKLLQLECHFTWDLKKEHIDVEDYEERINDSIKYAQMKAIAHCYNRLAYASHLRGKYDEALIHLQNAEQIIRKDYEHEIERQSVVIYGNFAWVYYHMGRTAEAQTYHEKIENICKTSGSTSPYAVSLPEVYGEKGWTLLTFSRLYYKKAKECFEKALQENADEPEWNSGYAVVLYRLETPSYVKSKIEDSKSLEQLRRALELNPEDTLVMVLLGLKLQDFGQRREALEYVEQALQKSPDIPQVTRYAAKFLRKHGYVDKSLQLLQKALEKTPNSAFLHHQIGLCYEKKLHQLRKGAHHQQNHSREVNKLIRYCIYHFEIAVELKPQFHFALLGLAAMYIEVYEYGKAEECFEKLLKMQSHTAENLQEVHLNYGLFLLHQKKSESNAILHFKEGFKIINQSYIKDRCYGNLKKIAEWKLARNANDSTAFGILGFLHHLKEEKPQAIECYEKALQFDPDNEEYLSALCELRLSI